MNANQIKKTTAYYVSFFGFGILLAAMGPALPYLAAHTGVSLDRVAQVFIFSSIGFFTGSIVNGWLYDRHNGNRILAASWLAAALTLWFIPEMHALYLLEVLLFITGFTNSSIVLGCNTLITQVDRKRTPALLNGMHVVNGVGAFISPLIFTAVIWATGDINLGYKIYSVGAVVFALLAFTAPAPERQAAKQKAGSAQSKALKMAAEADGLTLSGALGEKSSFRKRGRGREKQSVSTQGLLYVTALMAMIYVGTEITFSNWIFTYIKTLFQDTGEMAGFVNSAFWLFMTIGRLISVVTIRKFDLRTLLPIQMLGAIAGLAVILSGSSAIGLVWAGTIIAGISMGAVFPMIMGFSEQMIGLTGKNSGLLFAGTSIGGMIFPYMNGKLFTFIAPQALIVSMMCMIFIALQIFLRLRKQQNAAASESGTTRNTEAAAKN